ncbi:NAD(P)H-binding protein [Agromyces intestinalis]|uniref:NAD(P)H-binding protein n=1 Tax=Agromyces intestinalis TaxID=2592652 RepID=A0A5C1YFU2_9MICO|nr:NmrA family NAD(P)-binding protein [Agromyces intestinalis]QEO13889.1 NAD(P)H-binding protein [Agromyces intestinalis]
MILVTAANGNQGRLLIPKLLRAGHAVRAAVQSEASAAALRELGVSDVVVGDLSRPEVAAQAVAGVRAIYHVGPTLHPREREMGFTVIDAACEAGVGQFVFSSVLHAIVTDLVQHEIKRDVEEYLLGSGLEFTILQPSNYMLPLKLRPVFERDVFELSWSLERRQSLVDLDDVTEVAALALTEPERHAGATYELVAPGRYTAHELGAIISGVLGREIAVRQIDADTYARAWLGDRDPAGAEHELRVLRSISSRYSAHDFVGNPNVLTWLLGRTPTSFEAFVRREAARRGAPRPETSRPPIPA